MDDRDIHDHINRLVAREQELRDQAPGDPAHADERRRELGNLEASLDQLWDLLRQRQARREFGENPDAARMRPRSEVENYLD